MHAGKILHRLLQDNALHTTNTVTIETTGAANG
jgi:hypothetical protein